VTERKHVLETLDRLRGLDPEFKIFGSTKHRYELNTPIPDAELSDLETLYTIQLPEEYRWFLTTVGNGGAGPNYGVMTIEESVAEVTSWLDDDPENTDTHADYLSAPFVVPESVDRSRRMDYFVPGMIPISEQGCAYYCHLCISGVEYGNVWSWADAWFPQPPPGDLPDWAPGMAMAKQMEARDQWHARLISEENVYRVGFLDWYDSWLNESLKKMEES
jgi:hypothetical protein